MSKQPETKMMWGAYLHLGIMRDNVLLGVFKFKKDAKAADNKKKRKVA